MSGNIELATIRRILVPVDGSDASFKAATYAISIAKPQKAKIICLHVIGPAPYFKKNGSPVTSLPSSYYKEVKRQAGEWFAKITDTATQNGVHAESEVIINVMSIPESILKYSEKRGDIDLIIMGSKGMTGFKKLLLGSVASAVVTYASCPVLVVK